MNYGEVVSDRLASKRHYDLWARLTDTPEKEPMGLFFYVFCLLEINCLLSRKVPKDMYSVGLFI